jgi:23S rRNA (guanosine2251-2'-O)-methyltransferase
LPTVVNSYKATKIRFQLCIRQLNDNCIAKRQIQTFALRISSKIVGIMSDKRNPGPRDSHSNNSVAAPERRGKSRSSRGKPKHGKRFSAGDRENWLYGTHAVVAALANPNRTVRRLLLISRDHDPSPQKTANSDSPAPEIVTRDTLNDILPPGAVHQGMALLADPLDPPYLSEVCANPDPHALLLVLDQVTDPRNLGAIMRAGVAFGATSIIVQDRNAPPVTGSVAKAASGAAEILNPVRVTNLARAISEIAAAGFWCLGLDGASEKDLAAARPKSGWGRTALVLGAEGAGLRPGVAAACDELVRIPLRLSDQATALDIESLNVASAAAVALYEMRR